LAAAVLLSIPIMPLELWLIKTLVDRIQAWTMTDSIGPILMSATWLALLMIVNNIGLGVPIPMSMTRLNEIGTLEEQRQLMLKTSRLPLAAVETPRIKDLRERALQVSLYEIYDTGIHMLQNSLHSAVLITILLVFGQWIPVVAVCAAALLQLVVSGKSAESLERLTQKQTPDRRLLRHYAGLMTKRDAAKEIRLFGLGNILAERWTFLYEQQSKETWKITRSSELRKIGPELLMALLGGLLIALLVLLPGANKLTAGDFTLLFMALTMLLSQLPGLIRQSVALRTHYMRWEDFLTYLDLEEDCNWERPLPSTLRRADAEDETDQEAAVGTTTDKLQDSLLLQVHEIGFRYPGADRDTLSGVSFTIPPGCRAALVGENGSGKSTLIKLLTGLYSPDKGEIFWCDGKENRMARISNRDGISVVFQDFTRLYLTLRENVALGKLTAIEQDHFLQSALQAAGSKLSDLNEQLGAPFGGLEPSGGEWQKIATARAILRDASFVFFDEPTAALDPQAEKDAFELFLRVTEARSALLVTHRLGAAKMADVIFVLKDGRLVEQGTHDELMRRSGEYSRMFNLQASWYV
jgi:ATP-binding cassette, subfamily B, bacterial